MNEDFVSFLLSWYEQNGRDLPWRGISDPYAVLVSEIMLQQTQVERVIPKYKAWLDAFPNFETLAHASRADVLRLWSGLGYNNRALRLQRCAQEIIERFAGSSPDLGLLLDYYGEPMTSAGKALIETLFYYAWGCAVRQEDGLALGLDRDHELYQTQAFSYGYGRDFHMHHHTPLLYARRNNTNKDGGTLHQTSFRQFWR